MNLGVKPAALDVVYAIAGPIKATVSFTANAESTAMSLVD